MIRPETPVLGFCAYSSGMGKTTLLASLIPILSSHGIRVSVIKHAHHSFDIDHPGKDSYRLREAGAVQMLLGSRRRWAMVTELSRVAGSPAREPILADFLAHIDCSLIDLVMVEGFRNEAIAKIEIHRPELGTPLLADTDRNVIAIASNGTVTTHVPVLDLDNPAEIAAYIRQWLESIASGPRLLQGHLHE